MAAVEGVAVGTLVVGVAVGIPTDHTLQQNLNLSHFLCQRNTMLCCSKVLLAKKVCLVDGSAGAGL